MPAGGTTLRFTPPFPPRPLTSNARSAGIILKGFRGTRAVRLSVPLPLLNDLVAEHLPVLENLLPGGGDKEFVS